jgi:hypothetical protein
MEWWRLVIGRDYLHLTPPENHRIEIEIACSRTIVMEQKMILSIWSLHVDYYIFNNI